MPSGPDFFIPNPFPVVPPCAYDESVAFPYTGYGPGLRWLPRRFFPDSSDGAIVCTSEGLVMLTGYEVLLSTSLGVNWSPFEEQSLPDDFPRFGFAAVAEGMDVFVIGGVDDDDNITASSIWRSRDGGRTWNRSTAPFEPRMYPELAIHRSESGQLVLVLAGGICENGSHSNYSVKPFEDIWYSTDSGETWSNSHGSCLVSNLTFVGHRLFGNVSEKLSFSDNFGTTWTAITREVGLIVPRCDGLPFLVTLNGCFNLYPDGGLVKLCDFAPHPKIFDFCYVQQYKSVIAFEKGAINRPKRGWYSPELGSHIDRDNEVLTEVIVKGRLSLDHFSRIREFMVYSMENRKR
jgi:hypothetical protein